MNYSQNINLSDPNDYTHIDKPIARNNNVNPVTWVNFIEFSSVDNFGYGNLSGSIGGTWLTVLDTINNLFKDLNDRLIIVENAINNIDPNPNPDPDPRTLTSIMWSSITASSQKGAQISYPYITCVYNDGSTSSISATQTDVTISPYINSSSNAGTYQLYASYQGKTTGSPLIYTIMEAQIESIEWVSTSASSQQGSSINWPQIRCRYNDGTTTTINATASGVSLSNNLTSSTLPGTYNITATYNGKTTTNTLTYTIVGVQIESIEWVSTSASSQQGSAINWPQIRCIYDDRTTTTIYATASAVSLSNNLTSSTAAGTYYITATYTINNRSFTTTNTLTYTIIPDDNASITITKGTLSGNVQNFTVKSTKTGTLSLSTTAGTLNKNSISMTANQNESFTLTGNAGTNATAPIITITKGTMGTNSCTFTVKSTVAGALSLNASAGSLNKTSLSMTANAEQTVTITNNSSSAISPTITASQTVSGSTGQTINYTITATQTVNSVLSSATSTGSINGTTGQSATGTKTLTINNIPGKQQTQYYWYAGYNNSDSYINASNYTSIASQVTTLPASTDINPVDSYVYVVAPKAATIRVFDPNTNFDINMKTLNSSTGTYTNAVTEVGNYKIYRSAQLVIGTTRITVQINI